MALRLIALILALPLAIRALYGPSASFSMSYALVLAMVWPYTVAQFHHELAHAVVAKYYGIEVRAAGFHGNGSYVVLQPPPTGVTLRAWILTLAAGPVSNTIVGSAVLAGWSSTGREWFGLGGFCCILVATVELVVAVVNAVPGPRTDGGSIRDALRMARRPVVDMTTVSLLNRPR